MNADVQPNLAREHARQVPRLRTSELATLLLLALGCMLRARGYLFQQHGFWMDEGSWALRLFEHPFTESWLRPIGFLALSKLLAVVVSPSELVLRAVPWCAGLGALLVAPALARRLFTQPAARVLFVAVIALNPAAIDLAKEFKPYSLALALHLALLFGTLRYVQTSARPALAATLIVAAFGSLLSQDLVFAYPGTFVVLALHARTKRTSELASVAVTAAFVLLILLAQYLAIWRHREADVGAVWGDRWGVFFTPEQGSHLAWEIERYSALVGIPGIRRTTWQASFLAPTVLDGFLRADEVVWVWLHVLGLGVLISARRVRESLLLVLPLVVLGVFNAADLWPFGAFRTNLFSLAYTAAIAALALDVPLVGRVPRVAFLGAMLLVLAPMLAFERDWGLHKRVFTRDSTFMDVLTHLAELATLAPIAKRDALLLDPQCCDLFRYYTRLHPEGSRELAPKLAESFDSTCLDDSGGIVAALGRGTEANHRVFVVQDASLVDRLRGVRLDDLVLVDRLDLESHVLRGFARKR